ncbi:MAG: hypothetical protein U9P82_06215 [Bacteroidota bacterium]|nr:hypothetical protein [Bacteroidota bacterium]
MKTFKIILLTIITTALIFASCEKDKNEELQIVEFSYNCKASSSVQPETIHLKAINSDQLEITHSNVIFACCPNGELKIEFSLSDATIILNEFYTDISCNCLCPYDLKFIIVNLDYKEYHIQMQRSGEQYFVFDIDYNSNTDTTITINN